MTERPTDLPDYHNPPIDEVLIAVQFQPIEDMTDKHISDFWKLMRGDYPLGERQPRLEGPIESLDPVQQVTIQLPVPGSISGRMWMISEDDDFLIQVQNSRFIQNWRKRQNEYGHFETVRDRFWQAFRSFREYLLTASLSAPAVQQVEVTYFNWVPQLPMAEFLQPAVATVVQLLGETLSPEEQGWSAKYLLVNDSEVIQRLYAQCGPAIRPQTPDIRGSQLALTFRAAREAGLTDEELSRYFDVGRVVVVEAFTRLTTPNAHNLWGRYK